MPGRYSSYHVPNLFTLFSLQPNDWWAVQCHPRLVNTNDPKSTDYPVERSYTPMKAFRYLCEKIDEPFPEEPEEYAPALYPITMTRSRYGGLYSGGTFMAFPLPPDEIPREVRGDDVECLTFFKQYTGVYATGDFVNGTIKQLSSTQSRIQHACFRPQSSGPSYSDLRI